MNQEVELSVIIPVYNAEPYLSVCIDSVLAQDVSLEVICVDDCSTDNSLQICKEYERRDSRVRVVHNTCNFYAGTCRNIGLCQATGRYIHFLDADDKVVPGAYRKFCDMADADNLDVLRGTAKAFDHKTGEFIRGTYYEQANITGPVAERAVDFYDDYKNVIRLAEVPWTGICRRSFVAENRIFFNTLRCANDVSFFYDMMIHAHRIRFIREDIVFHRVNNANSLMGIRSRHYECVLECYRIVAHNIASQPKPVRKAIMSRLMGSMPNWTEKALAAIGSTATVERLLSDFISELDLSIWDGAHEKSPWCRHILSIIGPAPFKRGCGDAAAMESIDYRIGRVVTWPARKARGGVKCLRENGLKYTIKHIAEKVLRKINVFSLFSVVIALLLGMGFLANNKPVRRAFAAAHSWKETIAEVHARMAMQFRGKNEWIDCNGFLMRLMGRRFSNDVLKYRGGLLEDAKHKSVQIDGTVSQIMQWDSLLKSWGGRYILVLAPCKIDRALEMLPPGCDPKEQNAYESVDKLHELLSQREIPMLDLSFGLTDNLEATEKNFYRTDHHWRYEAAFSKFPEVARKIAALAGHDLPEDLPQFDMDNWQAISFKNDFLGSRGRRTGAGFAGKDDFTYFVPKFDTDIDFTFWSKTPVHRSGSFCDSILNRTRTARNLDTYGASRYAVYIGGGNYPISIKSKLAPCKMRLMVIKDSYALPMLGYLSTVFSHIEVIDPRGYTDSIAEFVKDFKPDVMMSLVNMKALKAEKFFAFDSADTQDGVASSISLGTVSKLESMSKYGYVRAECTMKPGVRYRLRTGPVELSGADDLNVADVCLYDGASKKRINVHSFRGGVPCSSWCFTVPPNVHKPQLLFYAGRVGDSLGKSAVYRDVVLEELNGGE